MSLPKGWNHLHLEKIAKIERGRFSPRPRNDPRYYGGKYPFVQTGDIAAANGTVSSFKQTLNDEGVKVSKVFKPGTILMTIAANIGETAITTFDVACPDSLVGITPNEEIDVRWLNYILQAKKGDLDAMSTKNAQKNINLETLKPLPILCPPFPEQKKIAEILSTWDRAIEQQQNLVDKAKNQLKGLRENIFLRSAISKNEITFDSVKLGALVEPVKTKNSVGCQRVLTASGEHGLVDQREYFNRKIAATNLDGYYYLRRGDFAYNRSFMKGYPVGAIKQLNQYDDGVVSTLYLCFRPNAEFDGTYARHLFESGVLNEELGSVVQMGARAHGLLNITQEDFYSISVPITEMRNQKALGQALDRVENFIVEAELLLKRYQMQKQGLMQKLLTGKVRVKV